MAIKTLKVAITLDVAQEVRHTYMHLREKLKQCLLGVLQADGQKSSENNIKILGDEATAVRKGIYSQSFLVFGVNESVSVEDLRVSLISSLTEQVQDQQFAALFCKAGVQEVTIEDQRSFRISLSDFKTHAREPRPSEKIPAGWIQKKIALRNDHPINEPREPSTCSWISAYIAISNNLEKIKQIKRNRSQQRTWVYTQLPNTQELRGITNYGHAEELSEQAQCMFLYGAFRPDDLKHKEWVMKHIIGLNGQPAILRRAYLFDTGYNPALFYDEGLADKHIVKGWVVAHPNPLIFKEFLAFAENGTNIGRYFPNDRSVGYYEPKVVDIELQSPSDCIGNPVGGQGQVMRCLIYHHSDQDM